MSTVAAYLSNDVTLATSLFVTPNPVETGDESDVTTLHIWCAKGSPGGAASGPISVYEVVKNALSQWVSSGVAMLDQGWMLARVVGGDTDSDPNMIVRQSEWTRLSSGQPLLIQSISADCAVYVEIKVKPPQTDGAPSETVEWRFRFVHDEPSAPLLGSVARARFRILRHIGDLTFTGWLDLAPPDTFPGVRTWAAMITPTGTPDALVHVGWRRLCVRGVAWWEEPTDLTLNQTAADGALGSGQEYRALITQPWGGGAAVATKGNKATAGVSTFPAAPASSSIIGWVKVAYQGGGVSVINAAAITVTAVPGRFRPWTEGGLVLKVGAGMARAGGLTLWSLDATEATLDDATTSYVWRGASGLSVTATDAPAVAGDIPICVAVTAGGVITSIPDRRVFEDADEKELHLEGDENTGRLTSTRIASPSVIDAVSFGVETAAAGASGSTTGTLFRQRGASSTEIFTNKGLAIESRPTLAAGATSTVNAMPEITTLEPGDYLVWQGDAITSGGTAASRPSLNVALVAAR